MEKKRIAKQAILSWGIPLITITSYGLLALQSDLRYSIPLLTGVTAFLAIILSSSHYFGERQEIQWSPLFILSVAILIRCLFLFRHPELSDDIYRYIWDGLQILHGNNPYRHAPSDVLPRGEFSLELAKRINHPELITIYPPTAQVIFVAGVSITKSVFGIKMLLCCFDLVAICMIMKILAHSDLAPTRAAIYAWHPIPVLEIAASGHIDGAGVLFLLISIHYLLLATRREGESSPPKKNLPVAVSGFAFGAAALVKLQPIVILPCLLIMVSRGRRLLFAMSVIAGIAIFTIPFLPGITNAFVTLSIYLINWEFSNFFFRSLKSLTGSGDTARLILMLFLIGTVFFLTLKLWKSTAQPTGSRFSFIHHRGGAEENSIDGRKDITLFFTCIYSIVFVSLMVNPTLYPWYSVILVCLLPFAAGPAGMIFSWSVLLSYYILIDYVYLGQWVESDFAPALICCGPVIGALLGKCITYLNPRKR